jgi:purine-binding chemotaxis protein CheW
MSLSLTAEQKYITFTLNNMEYAIEVEHVQSIEKMLPITRVPGTKDYVEGVINLRGVIVPVIDLQKKLGLGEYENRSTTRLLIVSFQSFEIGLVVDAANDVLDIAKENIEGPPEVVGSVKHDFIKGVVKVDDSLIIILKLEEILN